MKIFTNKNITQKIILAVVIVTLCNFIFPTCSRASVGGLLFDPIANIVVSVCDVIVSAFQNFFYDGTNLNALAMISNIFADYKNIPEMAYSRR